MSVLVTGASGFVGSEILRHCLLKNQHVLAIIRPRFGQTAKQRFERIASHWIDQGLIENEQLRLVKIISADLTSYISPEILENEPIEIIYHAAASTDFQEPLGLARKANVTSTQRIVQLALSLEKRPKFIHISTAFVCGKVKGLVRESDITKSFYNSYEQTKAESESVVNHSGLTYVILRPSIIVGDSNNGYTTHFRIFYSMFRLWFIGILPRAPVDLSALVDVVPVDYVVNAALYLSSVPEAEGEVFHLCSGENHVTPQKIVDACQKEFPGKKFLFSPLFVLSLLSCPFLKPIIPSAWKQVLEIFQGHFPYMGRSDRVFDTEKAKQLLTQANIDCPKFDEFGRILFRYCRDSNWGKKKAPRLYHSV